jgi:microcystin degradation protein MlrC
MLESGLGEHFPGRVAFAVVFDPVFVKAAVAVGVGGKVTHALGARSGRRHGDPVDVRDALVVAMSDGVSLACAHVLSLPSRLSHWPFAILCRYVMSVSRH